MPVSIRHLAPLGLVAAAAAATGAVVVAATAYTRGGSNPGEPRSRATSGVSRPADAGELPATARAALERGNDAYRASQYLVAAREYTAASRAAPAHAAPYFGILMTAQRLGDGPLADSATMMIGRLSGEDAAVHPGGRAPVASHRSSRAPEGAAPAPH